MKAVWCRRCKLELNDENKEGACLVSEGGAHLIREHWGQRPEWEVQYTYKGAAHQLLSLEEEPIKLPKTSHKLPQIASMS